MDIHPLEILYVVLIAGLCFYAVARVWIGLQHSCRERVDAVRRRRRFEAVRTSTPVSNPTDLAIERGIDSINSQFTVVRNLVIPAIVVFALLLIAPTFLAGASATTASLVGTVIAAIAGLALRPILDNALAGLVIGLSSLVRIGDTVKMGEWYGTIEDISATHTTIKTWDWRRYLVPNGQMLQSSFLNYSLHDTFLWAHVEFHVAPDTDLDLVREIALAAAEQSPNFADHEAPRFWVMEIGKDTIQCWVAAWANTPSAGWALAHDIRTEILMQFRRHKISLSLQRFTVQPEPRPPFRERPTDPVTEASESMSPAAPPQQHPKPTRLP